MSTRFQASSDLGKHSRYAGQLVRSGPPASVGMLADCHPISHPRTGKPSARLTQLQASAPDARL
jgi:hypothetical protein